MSDADKEWDKIRGEIKVNQALSKQKAKDLDAKQDSLFRDETRNNPNRAEMERRAVIVDDAKEAEKVEKAKTRAAENKYFEDKRIKPSPIVVEAELAKMKEILDKPKGGSGGGGGGGTGMPKTGLNKQPEFKAGGKVKSASSRADGCAIRGKTRA
jgi:hypothetical protein